MTKTARDMLMDRDKTTRRYTELVGGPMDGKRLREVDGQRFSEDPDDEYIIDGHVYRPDRVEGGVLFMAWVREFRGRR